MEDRSRHGNWKVVCDRCGEDTWASETTREWTGLRVHRAGCADRRHPQEFVRGRADRQKVPFARPPPPDVFIDIGTISLSGSTVSEDALPGTVVGTLAVSGVVPQVFTLLDNAGGRFAISGTSLVAGPVGFDFETNPTHQISVSALYGVPTTFTITVTEDQQAQTGLYAITGQTADLLFNRRLDAAYGSFAASGQDVDLRAMRRLAAETGLFALSGQDVALGRGYSIVGTFGSFVLTGQAATLTKMEVESVTLFAAMSVEPTSARKVIINTLINALKTAGVWSKIDVMWVLAAHDEQAGRLNWITPGTYTATVVNSVTFTADRGFAGDGVSGHLDTGFAPATHGVQFQQDNAHIGVYQRTGGGNGNEPFSANNASLRHTVAGGTGTSTRSVLNSSTQINGPAGGTQPIHGMGRRNDASNVSVLRDGAQVTAPSSAGLSALQASNMRIGVRGNSTFVTHQIAAAHMGAYLDDTESAALYSAMHTYMVAVGADT